jgi:hypothetical protein
MKIERRTFELASIAAGVVLVGWIAYGLKTNPRWAGDSGPGVGQLPRAIVQGYLADAYGQAGPAVAAERYLARNLKDHTPQAQDPAGAPLRHTIHTVVAEGLNVVVVHCIESSASGAAPATEAVDIFRAVNGRIVERTRAAAQPVPSCAKGGQA